MSIRPLASALARRAREGNPLFPRLRFGLVIALALVTASPAVAQQLRWKLAVGDQLKVDVSQQTTSTVTIASKPVKTTMEMKLETVWTVESAGEKQMKVAQGVKRLSMRLQVGDAAPVVYDSAATAAPVGAAKNVAAAVKPLLEEGSALIVTMDPRGEVISAEPSAKLAELWKTSSIKTKGPGRKESTEELLKRSLVVLPEQAVGPQDAGKVKWSKVREVEIAIGKVKQATEFVYGGEADESGLKLERIDFNSKLTLVPGGAQSLKLTLKEQSQTGHALFSVEQGRVVSAEQTQHLVTESPYRETIITVGVDSTVKTVVTPVKK